jgi:L-cysteate sulfo-lyase
MSGSALQARELLAMLPTPLEPLPRLSPDGGPRLWVKRDDCTGLGGGGNKVRKLEYLLSAARAESSDVILTAGAVQSNHARLTAAACARLGLPCELFLNQRVPERSAAYRVSGNVLLDRLFGARVVLLEGSADAEEASRVRAEQLREEGRRPYVIPVGGSNAVGSRGYVDAAHELLTQAAELGIEVGAVVSAVSSGGTLAGLATGFADAAWPGRLLGISVSAPAAIARRRVTEVALRTAAELDLKDCTPSFEVDDGFLGDGYGMPTPEGLQAVRAAARLEGLLLDPVYTGKALAGALAHLRSTSMRDMAHVVFLHTGGWPALFGYQEELACEPAR